MENLFKILQKNGLSKIHINKEKLLYAYYKSDRNNENNDAITLLYYINNIDKLDKININ